MIELVEFLDSKEEFEGIKLRLVRENLTAIFVPDPFFYKKGRTEYLPASLPVWYNPRMEINRDFTVLALSVYAKFYRSDAEEIVYVEALGGTGIRGFRVFKELVELLDLPIRVILNDVNPVACRLMEFNKEKLGNPDNLDIFCFDANYLFHFLRKSKSYTLDSIEIDPYGSPMPFIPSTAQILRGRGGLVLVSATDLAPLHGKFPKSALRKYGAWVFRNKFEAEIATRTLIYSIGREFTIYSKLFKPVFSLIYDGFVKVIGLAYKGKIKANSFWDKVVFLEYHIDDPYSSSFIELKDIPKSSESRIRYIGPIWGGSIADREFCELMLDETRDLKLSSSSKRKIERFLSWLIEGGDIPLFVDVNDFSSYSGGQIPPIDDIIEELKKRGVESSRTFFNYNAIKMHISEENLNILKQILTEIGKERTK